MKSCPACKNQYSDDTLKFCLQDGTPLIVADVPEQTLVMSETETFVPDAQGRMNIPVNDPNVQGWQPSPVTYVPTARPKKKGFNTMLAVALTAIGMLVLFVVIGVVAVVFWQTRQQADVQNVNTVPNSNTFSPNTSYNSSPTPVRTPPSTPQPTPVTPPLVRGTYPATTRLKFARGTYSTSFSGDINPGDSRSLVLACGAGQSLTAKVSSGNGCVQLSGGGSSFSVTTNRGDNYINVRNTCSSAAHFSVSITVL